MSSWFRRFADKNAQLDDGAPGDVGDGLSQTADWQDDNFIGTATGSSNGQAQSTTFLGAGSAAAGGSVPSPETITLSGSGLVFINTYTRAVTTAYRNDIVAAENYLQKNFINSVTVRVTFDLPSLGPSFSGSNSFSTFNLGYASLVAALQSHATSTDDYAAVASLQSLSDPSNGAGFVIPTAEARVLGLTGSSSSTDDSISLNSYYWTAQALQTSATDAEAVIEHELSEGVFGRISGLGKTNLGTNWGPMDLFRFTAQGQRDFTGGQDGQLTHFSTNGSSVDTGLQYHNAINSSGSWDGFDLGDWDGVGNDSRDTDPFGPGGPGVGDPGTLSATDLRILDVLGWTDPNVAWNVYAGSTTTIPEPGITVNILGTNVSLTASNDTVNMIGNVTASLTGAGDTVNMSTGDTINLVAGTR
jgi:hypothetical protein